MRKICLLIALLLTLLLCACGAQIPGANEPAKPVPPTEAPLPVLRAEDFPLEPASDGSEPSTEAGRLLARRLTDAWDCAPLGEAEITRTETGAEAVWPYEVRYLDTEALCEALRPEMLALLERRVEQAAAAEEIYEADGVYRSELLDECFSEALSALPEGESAAETLRLRFRLDGESWRLTENEATERLRELTLRRGQNGDTLAAELCARAAAELPILPLRYRIDENALCGPVPREEGFGETDDPAVVAAVLERPEARRLIGDQTTVWQPDLALFPGSTIRWYLDETILVLVWQEVEAREVGTFSEIFIADGSQLRRKISGDTLWSFEFRTTSRFAQDANAVLALGGDFYYHGRACGIGVYQRQFYRFEPYTCDNCYITSDGDMLFSYRGQITDQAEAEQFVRDNDVLFSLCFGPVLIDDGVDVTPETYPWGEVNDEYARSALGLLGRHHYLTMNLNHGMGEYYYLATLRQEADAMIKRGCVKAYALDGGQTATTVFHGQLINPVQFGWEKDISDIIYFATALPEG